jgi:poly(hydroxyalkanoate) depolymerase family esterase
VRRFRRLGRCLVTVLLGAVAGLSVPAPVLAAGLEPVSSFGSNPGNLSMYVYRPEALPANAPAVVLLHGCTQNAAGYFANSGWRKFADQWHFALVLPEQKTANNSSSCFTWFEPGDTTRDQGEALSVRQMVSRAVSGYGVDPQRVFVSGLSAGGAMSAVMLATYPDVFAAGSVVAGLPYRCATSLSQASGCQYTPPDRTPAQWGDLVRAAYPGYAGPRPRVAIWQGQSDYTVVPANGSELRDQFTNALGVPATPASTSSLPAGTTLETYGADQVRLYRVAGMGHGTPVDPGTGAEQCGTAAAYFLDTICSAYRDALFFGLGQPAGPGEPEPPAPACVTASNYAHVQAGRAYASGGYAYAQGSGQRMGLYNLFVSTTLCQTAAAYWVIG